MPSRMIAIIRSTSARSSGPKSATGEALLFSTGSPNLTTWRERRFAPLQQLRFELLALACPVSTAPFVAHRMSCMDLRMAPSGLTGDRRRRRSRRP